ncbi:MAG: IS481 family transposase [Nitrospiraceae bacterium]|nr:MAG: IS481 family transposase [Nitrospiraceae bacterium]
MEKAIRARFTWIKLYEETGDAGFVCRRCGVSRPTLRKWWRRYQKDSIKGLQSQSRAPKKSPAAKVGQKETEWILTLRNNRKLGARRIQSELKRLHSFNLSLATIHKVLTVNGCKQLQKPRRKKDYNRYSRPVPGDRVQMDTCKIGPGLYQYTAIDDCSRFMILALYNRRNASNTLEFIEQACEMMPFPIQRIQTDRGTEFFAMKVQKRFMDWGIKFRPIKPASPHLNGKVERAQKTVLYEFYSTIDMKNPEISNLLEEWQFYYNRLRPHGSLKGKSPMDVVCELKDVIPYGEDVDDMYDPLNERFQEQNYNMDLRLRKLKRSM